MLTTLRSNWGWLLFRGVLGVVVGLVAIMSPTATIEALMVIFGAYLIVDGIALVLAATSDTHPYVGSRMLFAEGLLTTAAGILSILRPGVAALAIVLLWAAWALVSGAFEVSVGLHLHRATGHRRFLVGAGIVSLLLGLLLLIMPSAGVVAMSWIIGLYAFFFGLTMIATALELRRHAEPLPPHAAQPSIRESTRIEEPSHW